MSSIATNDDDDDNDDCSLIRQFLFKHCTAQCLHIRGYTFSASYYMYDLTLGQLQ